VQRNKSQVKKIKHTWLNKLKKASINEGSSTMLLQLSHNQFKSKRKEICPVKTCCTTKTTAKNLTLTLNKPHAAMGSSGPILWMLYTARMMAKLSVYTRNTNLRPNAHMQCNIVY